MILTKTIIIVIAVNAIVLEFLPALPLTILSFLTQVRTKE